VAGKQKIALPDKILEINIQVLLSVISKLSFSSLTQHISPADCLAFIDARAEDSIAIQDGRPCAARTSHSGILYVWWMHFWLYIAEDAVAYDTWVSSFICSFIKLITKGYADVFSKLLSRNLGVFEKTGTENRTLEPDFLDLDIYSDLDHIPLTLKRTLTESISVLHGYSQAFERIAICLREGRPPIARLLDDRIRYSWDGKSEDAKLFLLAGGTSKYALQHVIRDVKELMLVRNGSRLALGGLASLPMCINDTAYDMVIDRLLTL
jgi:hypothetical protein